MDSAAYFGQLNQASGEELAAVLEATRQQEEQLHGMLDAAQGVLDAATAQRARLAAVVGALEGRLGVLEEAVTKAEADVLEKAAARDSQL